MVNCGEPAAKAWSDGKAAVPAAASEDASNSRRDIPRLAEEEASRTDFSGRPVNGPHVRSIFIASSPKLSVLPIAIKVN